MATSNERMDISRHLVNVNALLHPYIIYSFLVSQIVLYMTTGSHEANI